MGLGALGQGYHEGYHEVAGREHVTHEQVDWEQA